MMNTIAYSHGEFADPIPTSLSDHSLARKFGEEVPLLLQGIVESLIDGIMILTDQGELVFANTHAKRICHELTQNLSRCQSVPKQIWRSCQALIEGREDFPGEAIVIEDEIKTNAAGAIRLRASWLDLDHVERPCLLIALEDRQKSAHYKAIADAQKYGLTERETQVWILKQEGHTYKAIAATLHIAEDTVKKHVKSIHVKRDGVEWLSEAQAEA